MIVLDAVDCGLGFLNEKGKRATYYQIERRYDVSRKDIPLKLSAFQNALEGLFGYGGKIIEMQIAKCLYDELGLKFEEHDSWTLKEYVDHAKDKATVEQAHL